jgi:hypothetical protein
MEEKADESIDMECREDMARMCTTAKDHHTPNIPKTSPGFLTTTNALICHLTDVIPLELVLR